MRTPGAQMLSDYAGGKIIINCRCGVHRRYDTDAMMAKLGDASMVDLHRKLAEANGCGFLAKHPDIHRSCKMQYDIAAMRLSVGKQ